MRAHERAARRPAARGGRGAAGYLYATSSFKRRVVLKQQFTIEKGYYVPVYNTPYSEPDGLTCIYYRA